MRRLASALLLAAVLGGCNAAGEPDGPKRFSDSDIPFTFEIPADFTKADVDHGNSSGNVIAAVGLSKVDVLAVRRIAPSQVSGGVGGPHVVLGRHVTSEVHPLRGGYYLECQYTPDFAKKVLAACNRAVATVKPK